MLKLCLTAKSGKSLIDKTFLIPTLSAPYLCNLHALHNNFKSNIGKILGSPTHTIEENDIFIKELIEWKNNDDHVVFNFDKKIKSFIEANGNHQKTTVFFEKHWKYRFVLINLPLICYDYHLYHLTYPDEIALIIMVIAHLCSLASLPFGEGKSLTEVASLRKELKSEMDTYKIININKKKSTNDMKFSQTNPVNNE